MSKSLLKYMAVLAPLLVLSAGLQGCAQEEKTIAAAPVVLVRPAEPGIMGGQKANGIVESLGHHILASEVSGRIVRVNALVGARVSKGQVLAVIDPKPSALQAIQAQADLKLAETDFGLKQSNFGRLKGLLQAGTISALDLERAQTEAEAARQTVVSARARLGLAARARAETIIRAPVSGVISSRSVEASQIVQAGAPLFELEAGSGRIIRTFIPPAALGTANPGRTYAFVFNGQIAQAQLIGLNGKASATGAVEATLAVGGQAPLPGTPVTVHFDTAAMSGVRVPVTAINVEADGAKFVWAVNPRNQTERVRVTLVQLNQTSAIVTGAIAPGTSVVAAGTDWVKAGQKVTPKMMTR